MRRTFNETLTGAMCPLLLEVSLGGTSQWLAGSCKRSALSASFSLLLRSSALPDGDACQIASLASCHLWEGSAAQQ
jgi:hypothetical protein